MEDRLFNRYMTVKVPSRLLILYQIEEDHHRLAWSVQGNFQLKIPPRSPAGTVSLSCVGHAVCL